MTETVWAPIEGWAGYEVSDAGQVRSIDRTVVCRDGQRLFFRGQLLSQTVSKLGYLRVHLRAPGKSAAAVRVHRLVAVAFVDNPHGLPTVNHIDNDRQNNAASNLDWCTQAENLEHARKQGRLQDDYWAGRRSPNAALSDEQVIELRRLRGAGATLSALAETFGISKRAVGRAASGETYPLPTPPIQGDAK